MIKKQISKITIAASLLVATMVNAQEFYTCVPKKSWWKDTIKESVPENKVDLSGIVQELKDLKNNTPSANDIGKAVAGASQKNWNLIKTIEIKELSDNKILAILEPGSYKFKIKMTNKHIFENTLTIKKTSYLKQYSYYSGSCTKFDNSGLKLEGYDITDAIRSNSFTCYQADSSGVNAFIVDTKVLFMQYYRSDSEATFKNSTLEIYKKNDD